MDKNTQEFDAVKKFLDRDIVEWFEEPVADRTGDGTTFPRNWFVASAALVATNIQLMRILREAFERGFVVQK